MFQAFFHQSAAELSLQLLAGVLIFVSLLRVALRSRPQTINRQIDALARKTRSRNAA